MLENSSNINMQAKRKYLFESSLISGKNFSKNSCNGVRNSKAQFIDKQLSRMNKNKYDKLILRLEKNFPGGEILNISLMIKEGKTNREISEELGLTNKQVEYRIDKLKKEIGVIRKCEIKKSFIGF